MKTFILVLLMMPVLATAAFFECEKLPYACNAEGHMYSCTCYGWCLPDPTCEAQDITRGFGFGSRRAFCGEVSAFNGTPALAEELMKEKAKDYCAKMPFGRTTLAQVTSTEQTVDDVYRACAKFTCK